MKCCLKLDRCSRETRWTQVERFYCCWEENSGRRGLNLNSLIQEKEGHVFPSPPEKNPPPPLAVCRSLHQRAEQTPNRNMFLKKEEQSVRSVLCASHPPDEDLMNPRGKLVSFQQLRRKADKRRIIKPELEIIWRVITRRETTVWLITDPDKMDSLTGSKWDPDTLTALVMRLFRNDVSRASNN